MENYKEIEFGFGNIESAVEELLSHKELVFGVFNGQNLYSDLDDLDSAYKKVTGKTKSECEEAKRKASQEYKEQKRKHTESIPELARDWVEKGKQILDKKYLDLWSECVPIRLSDLYQGMELGMCLDIVKELNGGCEFEKVKEILENQGHSGMSYGLVCSMIKSFCNRGVEFISYLDEKL